MELAGQEWMRVHALPAGPDRVPGRELELRVEFATDVFTPAGVESRIGRLERILATNAAHPGRALSCLEFMS